MTTEVGRTMTVTIKFDEAEVRMLRAMIQNPTTLDEQPDCATFRARLFEHLTDILSI